MNAQHLSKAFKELGNDKVAELYSKYDEFLLNKIIETGYEPSRIEELLNRWNLGIIEASINCKIPLDSIEVMYIGYFPTSEGFIKSKLYHEINDLPRGVVINWRETLGYYLGVENIMSGCHYFYRPENVKGNPQVIRDEFGNKIDIQEAL